MEGTINTIIENKDVYVRSSYNGISDLEAAEMRAEERRLSEEEITNDFLNSLENNITVVLRRGLTTDISRRRDYRLLKTIAEFL